MRTACPSVSSDPPYFPEEPDFVSDVAQIRGIRDEVRYGMVFTSRSLLKQLVHAIACRLYGFREGKVKVGVAGRNDVTLVSRMRDVLGDRFDLRIDANEAWSADTLEQRVRSLVPYKITAVDQPVRHEEVAALSQFRGRCGVPLMLDESLCGKIDAQRAVDNGTCDLFNIRLSKCGGFIPSLRLAPMAHGSGLGFQLGFLVGETGILSAAGRHSATSIANIRYLEGSYDRYLVKESLTREDVTFGFGGVASRLTGVRLGVTVDALALQRVCVGQLELLASSPVCGVR